MEGENIMKKIGNKKIIFLTVMMIVIMIVNTVVLAADLEIPNASTPGDDVTGKVNTVIGTLLRTLQIIGIAVAVVMLIYIAIKYIAAAPGEKAELKKQVITYVIGAVVLFAAAGIMQLVMSFGNQISN